MAETFLKKKNHIFLCQNPFFVQPVLPTPPRVSLLIALFPFLIHLLPKVSPHSPPPPLAPRPKRWWNGRRGERRPINWAEGEGRKGGWSGVKDFAGRELKMEYNAAEEKKRKRGKFGKSLAAIRKRRRFLTGAMERI